jgi:hypothetical protein
MLAAPTSCASRADHSMIWVPTPMTPLGRPARITSFGYYLLNIHHAIRRAPPDGLRFVAGAPHCAGEVCPAIYECFTSGGKLLVKHTIPTRADGCDTRGGHGYQMSIFSPGQCWDGASLGMGMGTAGPPAHITSARRCRRVVIPQVMLNVVVGASGLGGYLSSDLVAGTAKSSPGSTGHFDFVFGWKNGAADGRPLSAIVSRCLDVVGFAAGRESCVQVPGIGGATIYAADPRSPVGSYPRCVTGPRCRGTTRFVFGQPPIEPSTGSRP